MYVVRLSVFARSDPVLSVQDLPVIQENGHDAAMLTSDLSDQSVPLPTHNILFYDGRMTSWTGE